MGDEMLAAWLEFMAETPYRMALEGGVAAIFGLVAWVLGESPWLKALPPQPRKLLWGAWASVGMVGAFFAAFFVPGFVIHELVPMMGVSGGATGLLAKTPAHKKLEQSAIFGAKKSPPVDGGQ